MVKVHTSVISYSQQFEVELRRQNSVTPKNYLDYIQQYRRQVKGPERGKRPAVQPPWTGG